MLKTHLNWVLSALILLGCLGVLLFATSHLGTGNRVPVEERSGAAQLPGGKRDQSAVTVDDVVEGYIRFLGGRAAIGTRVSFVATGHVQSPVGPARLTVYAKAPNKYLEVIDSPGEGRVRMGMDGVVAWSEGPEGTIEKATGKELQMAMITAAFTESLHMHELYRQLVLKGQQTVEGRTVSVLEADLGDEYFRRMYFATESGELLRTDMETPTHVVSRFYYDYRDIDGVQCAFIQRTESLPASFTYHVEEMRINVPIKDSFFSAPSSARQQQ
jgi:hypothetical protein